MADYVWKNAAEGYVYVGEPVSKKVERLEKELAEAKAKLAAEAEAKKPKTVGERVAAEMIEPYHSATFPNAIHFMSRPGYGGQCLRTFDHNHRQMVLDYIRDYFARAINKVDADARAQTRTEMKHLAIDAVVRNCSPGPFAYGRVDHLCNAIREIK